VSCTHFSREMLGRRDPRWAVSVPRMLLFPSLSCSVFVRAFCGLGRHKGPCQVGRPLSPLTESHSSSLLTARTVMRLLDFPLGRSAVSVGRGLKDGGTFLPSFCRYVVRTFWAQVLRSSAVRIVPVGLPSYSWKQSRIRFRFLLLI
jgi:hypothetical protein